MKTRRATALLAAGAASLLAGCSHVQSALAPAGDQAAAIERVWDLMLWICVPMYLLVLAALGWALWRKHSRGHTMGGDRHAAFGLAAFVILVAGLLTVLTASSYIADRRLHVAVTDPVKVRITAMQWWWQVDYLDADPSRQFTTANELHLPVDRPTRIELRSNDVIHSLWIPVLNGKEDLIPGRTNVIVMTPRKTGTYRGQCAEFCGLQHANMALDVQVDDTSAFAAWKARQLAPAATPSTPTALAGMRAFNATACAMCHTIAGTDAGGVTGPNLTHLASRRTLAAGALPFNRGTLSAWIADPQRQKPGTNMPEVPLQQQQLADIVDYLMTLQ
ncbi:cytochrome c oxidase subunit II [Dyella sp. KRB-257]|uniref:cytochrome c oxidase subunit II n=1 Tax=Dyella sp. KRB-257 TaxID=3400915 RepID=UPI003BFC7E4C